MKPVEQTDFLLLLLLFYIQLCKLYFYFSWFRKPNPVPYMLGKHSTTKLCISDLKYHCFSKYSLSLIGHHGTIQWLLMCVLDLQQTGEGLSSSHIVPTLVFTAVPETIPKGLTKHRKLQDSEKQHCTVGSGGRDADLKLS